MPIIAPPPCGSRSTTLKEILSWSGDDSNYQYIHFATEMWWTTKKTTDPVHLRDTESWLNRYEHLCDGMSRIRLLENGVLSKLLNGVAVDVDQSQDGINVHCADERTIKQGLCNQLIHSTISHAMDGCGLISREDHTPSRPLPGVLVHKPGIQIPVDPELMLPIAQTLAIEPQGGTDPIFRTPDLEAVFIPYHSVYLQIWSIEVLPANPGLMGRTELTRAFRVGHPLITFHSGARKPGLGDHCAKCGYEVKERGLFNSTFVGCLC